MVCGREREESVTPGCRVTCWFSCDPGTGVLSPNVLVPVKVWKYIEIARSHSNQDQTTPNKL